MIAQIQGKLIEKSPTEVIIDCAGIGYQIHISLHTFSLLPVSDFVKLYTHQIIKEDAHLLYGFCEKSERELFKMLISVSGIGAGIARTMLSSIEPKQIIQAIATGNVASIQSIKGIGPKSAQRVIIELKDKVIKIYDIEEISSPSYNINREEALSALEVLGFVRKTTEKVIDKILAQDPNTSTENIIKQALKNL